MLYAVYLLFKWHNILPSVFFNMSYPEQNFLLASIQLEAEERAKEGGINGGRIS